MESIPHTSHFENTILTTSESFFRKFHVSSILRASNAYKARGIAAVGVFLHLFNLAFLNRSMYMDLLTRNRSDAPFAKDTCYRLINSQCINWIRFTSLLAARIINSELSGLTGRDRVNVFIVDDTPYERGRSKKAELLARVYNHSKHIYIAGFRLLTLGWSDGNTFIPVNGCLLSSQNKEARLQEQRHGFDKRTQAFRRRKLAQTKAPSVMLELIDAAVRHGIHASYVLFDSWFCSPASLLSLHERGLFAISMAKKTSKVRYAYRGEMLTVKDIYGRNRHRRGRSKYLMSADIEIRSKDGESHIPAKLVYVRNRNKPKEYLVLISTDTAISEEEIIRIYGRRWDIEVFFKMSKGCLKLTKECHSLSYDAMTAYTAIAFTRYMMLALENRQGEDTRTFGELYYSVSDELSDITWDRAFHILMEILRDKLSDKACLSEEEILGLLDEFINAMPQVLRERLRACA